MTDSRERGDEDVARLVAREEARQVVAVAPAERLFDVEVAGYGSAIYSATTRGKALSDAWRCDAFGHISFKAFMSMARVRVRKEPPPTDGYSYVRERYGIDPKVGGRARISKGEGKFYNGREGTILWAGMARYNHIKILLDGDMNPLNFHPSNVVLLPSSACETHASQEGADTATPPAPTATGRVSVPPEESCRHGTPYSQFCRECIKEERE